MLVPPRSGDGLSPLVPLAYLACAAVALVAAATGTAWLAPELASHYYHPRLLALTHVVTLGWVTVAILGASYQLIPIAFERPIWSPRVARWQLAVLVVAVIGMVAHLALGSTEGLFGSAVLVAVGVSLHLLNVAMSLRGFTRWTFTARLVALSYAGLAVTTLFGLALALNRLAPFLPGDHLATLHAHAQLGFLGWVAPMILGVSARVYPMFLLGPAPRAWTARLQLWGLALGVPAVVAGLLAVPGLAVPGALAVTAAALGHAAWVVEMARGRKRPALDWGLRFALTATAFLLPAAILGVALARGWLAGPRAALAYAVVILGGWVSLTIVGMMLKIVPFLVWYRAYAPRAGREPVPTLIQLSSPRLEALAYTLLTGGAIVLAVASLAGDPAWIRMAGLTLTLGALAFVAALTSILRHLACAATGTVAPRSSGTPAPRAPSARGAGRALAA